MISKLGGMPFRLGATFTGILAIAACGSGSGGTGTGGSSSAATTTTTSSSRAATTGVTTGTGTGAGGSSGMSCPPSMTYGGGEQTLAGSAAKATIVDETGAPVAGQPIYICGLNVCTDPGMTGATGSAAITTTLSERKPAFKYGDTLSYAEFAIPLTTTQLTDFTTLGSGKLATAKLAGTTGAPLAAGSAAVAGDVTVSVPAGASIGINTLVYSTPDMQMFRAVGVPIANMGPVFDSVTVGDGGAADFALVYGVAPVETTLCPAATVTVALPHATMTPNDLGWTPGAAVEFWIMTTDTGQTYAPYAGWAKMSDGVVSTDGKSVATVAGQGFILLENFAIRLKS